MLVIQSNSICLSTDANIMDISSELSLIPIDAIQPSQLLMSSTHKGSSNVF